ncbi:manganese efflux pump [Natroniella sulfidigena]|uniref:manganese efflux pump MntP n=1 Tax=Natroniella sulfidigena TaxID=723921 RepID=UPI00200A0892|nr:manganese efflux pump [Natroniella sulfidigena]MCK8816789.1 manganese efflux pump [Natroniella sulfidigena]
MLEILIIAIALSLDAFGVALALGSRIKLLFKEKVILIFSFGCFQFLLSLLGAILGGYINNHLFDVTDYLSGAILLFLGLYLLKEGYQNQAEEVQYKEFNLLTYILLGVTVSVDALGVGFSILHDLSLVTMLNNSLLIGFITSIITMVALIIVNQIRDFVLIERYADYFAGLILIILGLAIII